ncbi:MAG: 3-deoxy-manno-octulosonate cytidylyltransferase [Gammaproteobacteria bacterium]|nr:3-deoxy-manno-octulosonate cytidylyltransferase [Gammaproteobacteria bacterium]
MKFKVYIPARYASTRLPGKSLLVVQNKSLIQHVYERALASGASEVVIATDDQRVEAVARDFGAIVCLTSPAHLSGSDRIAEAVVARGEPADTIIVNLQGDEPSMPASVIRQVAALVGATDAADIGTVCEPFDTELDWRDPNQVKVVRREDTRALYFSRAPIPYPRELSEFSWSADGQYRRHVGIYSYSVETLLWFVAKPPHPLESSEKLEQLRALAQGARIAVPDAVAECGVGIDTPADLVRWQRALMSGSTA